MKISKTQIVLILLLAVLIYTNPSLSDHQSEITRIITKEAYSDIEVSENEWENAGTMIGMSLGKNMIESIVESAVSRQNLIVFSLTKVEFNYQSKIIGIGILGNVWLFKEFKLDDVNSDILYGY